MDVKAMLEKMLNDAMAKQGKKVTSMEVFTGNSLEELVAKLAGKAGEAKPELSEKEKRKVIRKTAKRLLGEFNDPHAAEALSARRARILEEFAAAEDGDMLNFFNALCTRAQCQCGNPEHKIEEMAIHFLLPAFIKRLEQIVARGKGSPEDN